MFIKGISKDAGRIFYPRTSTHGFAPLGTVQLSRWICIPTASSDKTSSKTKQQQLSNLYQERRQFTSLLFPSGKLWNPNYGRRALSFRRQSPYDLLGVSRSATDKEIKLAYFREAKKYHPDLNPDDPTAKAKFQEISAAYELLSDPTRRRMYDTTGFSGDTNHQSHASQQQQQQHAEETFYAVQQDVEVVKEAVGLYFEEMKDEMNYAIDCMMRRDWKGLGEVANAHKGIVLGVVVPTILFLRYPPAVFAIMRVLFAAGQLAAAGLVYTGQVEVAVRALWQAIVKVSLEQKRRSEERRKTR